jgi:stearoyl-CoA desaturase (delta-9 desaturase)
MFSSGLLDLPWWGNVLAGLALVQITIAGVTLYLHRCQAHRALDMHPAVSHFFRFWLWLTTGMITKEWAAIHRKHHAKCETEEDPHSPRIHGINKILWGGVVLYVKESYKKDVMDRYGHSTPTDWLERNVYTPLNKWGIALMAFIDVLLFGPLAGAIIWGVQMLWIPFWAAGVINGIGHYFGYRNFHTEDDSTNIVPWAAWIGGEELHNNHHAYPTSAKFSIRPYEFDLGWLYIRMLQSLGLATVRKQAPKVKLDPSKWEVDAATLQAVIAHRFDVMANYAKSMKRASHLEIERLRAKGADYAPVQAIRKWWHRDQATVPAAHRERIARVLETSPDLKTTWSMREELQRIWERSTLTTEQLVGQLKDWCERAEKTNTLPLVEFSHRLRSYA